MRWLRWLAVALPLFGALVLVVLPSVRVLDRFNVLLAQAPVPPLPNPPVSVAKGASWGVDCDLSKSCPAGRWRVYRTAVRTQVCSSEVWNRVFANGLAHPPEAEEAATYNGVLLLDADDSSTGTVALTPLTKGTGRAKVGTKTEWWEYTKIPGLNGNYVVSLTWAGCPDQSTGQRTIYVVPFAW